jgi:hypothetical protein
MTPDPGTIVTIVGLAVAAIVWFVRIEGRQHAHERECLQYRQLVSQRADATDKKLDHIDEKLDRVVERLS